MKKTIVVLSTNRAIEYKTRDSIKRLTAAGAAFVEHTGAPADVACARNIALTLACALLRQHAERDVLLCVDDDMEFSIETAQALVDSTRADGIGAGAVYATLAATIAAVPMPHVPGRYLCGLGLLALPREPMLELERTSESFRMAPPPAETHRAFTWCGPDGNGSWIGEDYRLCLRLGGVRLLPLGAGHIKKQTLWPDAATLELVRERNAQAQ